MEKNHFLDNIKRLRNEKEISQKQMAERLGFAQNNYSKIERGLVELTVNRLYEIAEILGVSIFQILLENKNDNIEETLKNEIDKINQREFLEKMAEEIKAKAKQEFEKEMEEQFKVWFADLGNSFKKFTESINNNRKYPEKTQNQKEFEEFLKSKKGTTDPTINQ